MERWERYKIQFIFNILSFIILKVCISHEGLESLVKCAEILKVKGLCDGATTSIKHSSNNANDTNDNLTSTQDIEIGELNKFIFN